MRLKACIVGFGGVLAMAGASAACAQTWAPNAFDASPDVSARLTEQTSFRVAPDARFGAQIEILQMKLRQYEGNQWQFQQLDLATIRSLTPRNALLQPLSWQVTGGLERVPGKHDDETLVSHVNGGGGGTWQLGEDVLGFALGTVRVEHNNDFAELYEVCAVIPTRCRRAVCVCTTVYPKQNRK